MILRFKNEAIKYAETIVMFFILIFILNITSTSSDYKMIDFKLVFIVLAAALFGIKQCILAIIMSCVLYVFSIHKRGIDVSYLFYSMDTWAGLVIYSVTGFIVSYQFARKKQDIFELKDQYENLSSEYNQLRKSCDDLIVVKEQLQKQIVLSKEGFGKLYEIGKELNTFNPRLIFLRAIDVVEKMMENDSVCIYVMNENNDNYARLISSSYGLSGQVPCSIKLEDMMEMKKQIEKKGGYANKNLDEGYPVFAAPIMDEEKIIAIVMIYNLDFEKQTLFYQNLFYTTVKFIQDNLVKAFKYTEISKEEIFVERNTNILKPEHFKNEIDIVKQAKEEMNLRYIIYSITDEKGNKIKIYDKKVNEIPKLLRTTDFIGCDEDGNIYVVLIQISRNSEQLIKNRFNTKGMDVKLEENGDE